MPEDIFKKYGGQEIVETTQRPKDPFAEYSGELIASPLVAEILKKQKKPAPPAPKAPASTSSPQQDTFFRAIGATETGGSKNPYEAVGPKGSSASGKYQFLWNTWGPAINKFAGRKVTREQFLKDPQLQEDWARHYYLREVTPQANHYWSRYQKNLKAAGVRNLEEVKAMIHFLGANGVKELATTGKYEVPGQNLTIPQYLGKFRTALVPPRKATPVSNKKKIRVGRDLAEVPANELNRVLKDHPNAIILD